MTPGCDTYLLRFGELALKGRNRDRFVDNLVQILKPRVAPIKGVIEKHHKKLLLRSDAEPEAVRQALSTVFGISGVSPIWRTDHQKKSIFDLAWNLTKAHAGSGKTFAVRAKRALKTYPINSMQLQKEVAASLLEKGLDLKVDLSNPDITLAVVIDFKETWLFLEAWPGLGGLPIDPGSKHTLLLSGGIDSPVAGHLIQKRGGTLAAVYCHTPPFTVEAAREKVVDLAGVLARYQADLRLFVVSFTEIMKTIRAECREPYIVVLARRFMMRVVSGINRNINAHSIVTGESLGQVASQTIENIAAIGEAAPYPILRPLIGMDKLEIIAVSKRIGAYQTSIQPFQDCCSMFSPKEPVTRARLSWVQREEKRLDVDGLVERALAQTEETVIRPSFP